MVYSYKCLNRTTYYNQITRECVACPKPVKGREVSPNCGKTDTGGTREVSTRKCPAQTFNDGTYLLCQKCTACQTGFITVSNCTNTADTKCQDLRKTTQVPVTELTGVQDVSTFRKPSTVWTTVASDTLPLAPHLSHIWAVSLILVICMLLVVLSTWLICRRRKRGQNVVLNYARSSSYISAGFTPLSAPAGNNEDFLSSDIFSAPLQTVLDNLDVLEELVILLDPETQGVKNTRHLASLCSFPSTWITYSYSMRESKSPLKAVLEGVTSRHPEWTVGHLAKLLRQMERNDAINVLTKLKQNYTDSFHLQY